MKDDIKPPADQTNTSASQPEEVEAHTADSSSEANSTSESANNDEGVAQTEGVSESEEVKEVEEPKSTDVNPESEQTEGPVFNEETEELATESSEEINTVEKVEEKVENEQVEAETGNSEVVQEPPEQNQVKGESETSDQSPQPMAENSADTRAAEPTDTTLAVPIASNSQGHKKNMVAIIIALLVAVVLVGIGYAAYLSSNNQDGSNSTTENSQTDDTNKSANTAPVGQNDVDTQTEAVDQVIKELDSLDTQFNSNELSDTDLGI
jgi:hypothetical protein